jgi:nucleotide-binding universal stress UspA family protein
VRPADPGAARRGYHASVTLNTHAAADAAADFRRARRRADLREVLSALGAREAPLLSYDDVRKRLHAVESPAIVLEDVPLDAIVGSVGRTVDFTREFLPRSDADKDRWVGVKVAMTGLSGTPPIDVYRIGDAYFVRDGNHRVSVARQLGARFIQAYVTPVHARVPLSADASPDELIIAEEHARFLERTALDELRPGADVRVTTAGAFERLLEHIEVHRYYMGIDEDRPVPYPEAVGHWYDTVYLPVVARIRASDLLRGFEGRTETDLYLWLSEHRGRLTHELGFELPSESIADAVGAIGRQIDTSRQGEVLAAAQRRDGAGPVALTDDVLVALADDAVGEAAVAQALVVARLEGARLYGLFVVPNETERASPAVARVRERFEAACDAGGVHAQFAVAVGAAMPALLARAAWVDLVVAPLATAGAGPVRLSPGHHTLLRRSPRPVLAVTGQSSPLTRALVAFDGGARSEAALFAGAYLAARHDVPLVVVTVAELTRTASATLADARAYLERHGLVADYVEGRGPVAEAIVATAEERGCDVVLMGSYRYAPWLETMIGGVLERVLRSGRVPVLVT